MSSSIVVSAGDTRDLRKELTAVSTASGRYAWTLSFSSIAVTVVMMQAKNRSKRNSDRFLCKDNYLFIFKAQINSLYIL
jgi:hypothetical protein